MEITVHSTAETEKLASELALMLKPLIENGVVLALYGDLGAGKTTFTNFLVKALGVLARVQSPTFVIARRYIGESLVINHLDLYRLKSSEELEDLDLQSYFSERNSITLIEWPQIAETLLPEKTIKLTFTSLDENTRRINVGNLY